MNCGDTTLTLPKYWGFATTPPRTTLSDATVPTTAPLP